MFSNKKWKSNLTKLFFVDCINNNDKNKNENRPRRRFSLKSVGALVITLVLSMTSLVGCGHRDDKTVSESRKESVRLRQNGCIPPEEELGSGIDDEAVKAAVEAIIAQYGEDVQVTVKPLSGNGGFSIRGDKKVPSASMIKMLVASEYIHQLNQGSVKGSETLTADGENVVDGTGSIQYNNKGKYTVAELVQLMINVSDNIATNVLIDRFGFDAFKTRASEMGLSNTVLERKLNLPGAQGTKNFTSSDDMAAIFMAIGNKTIGNETGCEEVLNYLKEQEDNDAIPKGLGGTEFAHKTGTLSSSRHDGGIVYASSPYVFVILTQKPSDEGNAIMEKVAKVVHTAYGAAIPQATNAKNTTAVKSSGEVIGGDTAEKCWNFLKSKGFTDEAAAGIMGNFEAESGMNPANIQGNGKGPAAGLFQMETYNVDNTRWGEMKKVATKNGKDWTDLASQLEFLEGEATSQFNEYTGKEPHYYESTGEWCWWPDKMTYDEYKKLTDIDKAAEIFCRVYERPSITNLDRRKASAHEYYERFKGSSASNTDTEKEKECEDGKGNQSFGASGIANGDEYAQFQGRHYDSGEMSDDIDDGAMGAACGATAFTVGVNMLLGQRHKYCNCETWHEMGSDSTTIGWDGGAKGSKWLKEKGLDSQIEITGTNDIKNREDLLNKLKEGNVCVVSSANKDGKAVFVLADGSKRSSGGHYILFYKYENGIFYADDSSGLSAGGGMQYKDSDVDEFFSAREEDGGSISIKRK